MFQKMTAAANYRVPLDEAIFGKELAWESTRLTDISLAQHLVSELIDAGLPYLEALQQAFSPLSWGLPKALGSSRESSGTPL
jgi:hypothetical protein